MRRPVMWLKFHGRFQRTSRLNISIKGEYFKAKIARLGFVHGDHGRFKMG
jgi:hypothetical protein